MEDGITRIEYVTRFEHNEFVKRMEQEDKRINARLAALEKITDQINSLTISVNKMAVTMEQMLTEQKEQGDRLRILENAPRSKFEKFRDAAVTAAISCVVTAVVMAWLTMLMK